MIRWQLAKLCPALTCCWKIANPLFATYLEMQPEKGISSTPFALVQLIAFAKNLRFAVNLNFAEQSGAKLQAMWSQAVAAIAPNFTPPYLNSAESKESEAVQACSSSLKLTGILKIKIMKLMEVQGLDNRSLDLVVWLKVLKQLSRLSWSARDILLFPCTTAWASADLMAGQGNAPAATQAFPLITHGNLISCFLVYRITRLSYSWVWEQEDSANKDIFIAGLTPVVLGEG